MKKQEFNLNRINQRWSVFNNWELGYKKRYLRKLSIKQSFGIYKELYRFAYSIGIEPNFNELDIEKIKTLAHVHSVFGKVGK